MTSGSKYSLSPSLLLLLPAAADDEEEEEEEAEEGPEGEGSPRVEELAAPVAAASITVA